ncbi:MAG: VOC family protein, partial [bacterium]
MPTTVKKVTPLLYVDEIEPVLPFWTERLGFEVTVRVPEGDRLEFVILAKDGTEVMYQTRASVEADVPAAADTPMRGSILFIQVEDIDAVEAGLEGVEPVVPRRTTLYGAEEVWVHEPAGNLGGFAQFGEE